MPNLKIGPDKLTWGNLKLPVKAIGSRTFEHQGKVPAAWAIVSKSEDIEIIETAPRSALIPPRRVTVREDLLLKDMPMPGDNG